MRAAFIAPLLALSIIAPATARAEDKPATLPASYILSPGLNDMNMVGQPLCTQGMISTQ